MSLSCKNYITSLSFATEGDGKLSFLCSLDGVTLPKIILSIVIIGDSKARVQNAPMTNAMIISPKTI